MKKLIPILLAILLLTGCAEVYDGPTTERTVVTEHLTTHYPFAGWGGQSYTNRTVMAYDIYGNQVRRLEYRDDELTTEVKTRFDEQGHAVSVVCWDHTGWIPYIDHRVEQSFDEQGRLTSYISKDLWGRETSRSIYTYDDEANTMTWEDGEGSWSIDYYDESGNKIRSVSSYGYETVYEYDDRGNRVCMTDWKDGAFFNRYEAGYDDQDRQIWGRRYDENGVLASETIYVFDDENHTRSYDKNDGGKHIEYFYPDGRLARIEDYYDGELSMVQTYTHQTIRVPTDREE